MNATLEVIAYPIDDVPSIAGVTRTQVFEAIRAKELMARKRGRRTLIEASELRRWVSTFPIRGRTHQAKRSQPKINAPPVARAKKMARRAPTRTGQKGIEAMNAIAQLPAENKNPVVSLTIDVGGELKTITRSRCLGPIRINFRRISRGHAHRAACSPLESLHAGSSAAPASTSTRSMKNTGVPLPARMRATCSAPLSALSKSSDKMTRKRGVRTAPKASLPCRLWKEPGDDGAGLYRTAPGSSTCVASPSTCGAWSAACRLVSTANRRRAADADARYGERGMLTPRTRGSLPTRQHRLTFFTPSIAPLTRAGTPAKSQRDRTAVRETYREWAVAFLGEADARPVIASAARAWGAA